MMSFRLQNHVRKICALLAAILILPALAPAQNGQGQNQNGQGQNQNGQRHVTVFPEANAGIVLIPFVGAVLVLSSLQLLRAKRAKKNGF
jgi:hypothetical protein